MIQIPGINTAKGLALYRNKEELYTSILLAYAQSIPNTLDKLRVITKDTLRDGGILAHGLKGSAAGIAADELRDMAYTLELAAKNGDAVTFMVLMPQFIRDTERLTADITAKLGTAGKKKDKPKADKPHSQVKTEKAQTKSRERIIVVDDNPANLNICKKALKDFYDVEPVSSAEEMFVILESVTPDLILLDVEMPGIHGYDAMKRLKEDKTYKEIPVIFLSAMDDAQSEMEGLNLGAVDYIHKPFVSSLLIKRIETHIQVIRGRRELLSLNKTIKELLRPEIMNPNTRASNEEEAIKDLILKTNLLIRVGHELRPPLKVIIEMLETAIQSDEMAEIKNCLGRADIESRLILEIINRILDISEE